MDLESRSIHIDFQVEGLLDGLDEQHRAERVSLLEQLVVDGVPLAELRRRSADGTIMFLPAERVLTGSREIAVGFADLVGFTRLGEEVSSDELGRLSARLEALASEVVESPVRLVKTIGDAVMLASPDPATSFAARFR